MRGSEFFLNIYYIIPFHCTIHHTSINHLRTCVRKINTNQHLITKPKSHNHINSYNKGKALVCLGTERKRMYRGTLCLL